MIGSTQVKSKKAFTLVELLITITLMSIIFMFLYKSLSENETFLKAITIKIDESKRSINTITILGDDIFFAKSIKLKQLDKKFTILDLETSHSINEIIMPYVRWIVKEDDLIRMESSKKITELNENMYNETMFKNVNTFKLQRAKHILSFIKVKTKKYINYFPLQNFSKP